MKNVHPRADNVQVCHFEQRHFCFVSLVILHIDLNWIILYITTRSWDKIRVSADRTKYIICLTLVGSGEGHLPRCSISAESLCCSSAASGHMLLHKTDLVVSIFLDMGLSHRGSVHWALYLHKHNLYLGALRSSFAQGRMR